MPLVDTEANIKTEVYNTLFRVIKVEYNSQ